jgi:hypothetical protein
MNTESHYFILLATYALYLVFQGFFINGVKLASEGSTELLPNGKEKDGEMLLYPMAKELLRKRICKIFYSGAPLQDIYEYVVTQLPELRDNVRPASSALYFLSAAHLDKYRDKLRLLQDKAMFESRGIKMEIEDSYISFSKQYDEYVYSKWIRKPVIQCIICMASFWGILTFLIPMLIISHFNPIVIPAYLVNTVILGAVNKIIYKYVK